MKELTDRVEAYFASIDRSDLAATLATMTPDCVIEYVTDGSRFEGIVPPFPRLHYDDAVKILHEGFEQGALENKFEWGGDLGSPDETYISSQFDKPVMVHRYPAQVKAFYMEPDPQRPELALCVDVLAPEGYGEIIGGGQRIHDLDLLLKRLEEHQLPREAFEWYLDLRKYGIKVTTIMPGSVATHFNNHIPNDADAWKIQPEDIGQMVVDLLQMNPRTLPSKVEVRPAMPVK